MVWIFSNRLTSRPDRSVSEVPVVITSASAREMPTEWVTQTASAMKNPSTPADSPTSDPPSGVKEKTPLKARSTEVCRSSGSRLCDSSHSAAKSSGVNGRLEGIASSVISSARYCGRSSRATGMGRCAYEPIPIRSPHSRK